MTSKPIKKHTDLDVYKAAFGAAMGILELSKAFPKEERYSLTDQVRRSSRSVCANLAEAWRKRRYEAAFIAKLTDCEAEAAETEVWLHFAVKCQHIDHDTAKSLYQEYEGILGMLVRMIETADKWTGISH